MTAKDSLYYSQFRRLHPLTLAYRAIMSTPQLLIILYFAIFQKSAGDWFYLVLVLFFGFFTFPFILLNYYYFQFLISNHEIIIKSGVLSRQQRNIPLEKIQNIEITRNFLQRLLGLARVTIETAGGAHTEGQLEFISLKEAELIRNIIRNHQAGLASQSFPVNSGTEYGGQDEIIGANSKPGEILVDMSLKDIIVHGMLRFRPVVLIFIFWLFSVAQQFYLVPEFEKMDISGLKSFINGLSPLSLVLYISAFLLLVAVTSWIIDILLSINKFYRFKLTVEGKKLHSEHGLFNTRKGIIPLDKLQMIVKTTNPLRKLLGYWGMRLETAGLGDKNRAAETTVPFMKEDRLNELILKLRDFTTPDSFIPISKKAIRRAFVRYLLMLALPVGISFFIIPETLWLLSILPLLYYAAYLRYQYRGYYIAGDTILVRQGFWFQRISIIPVEKIQTLDVTSTFFQRRLSLTSLHIDTASTGFRGVAAIADIDTSDAYKIMDEINSTFKDYYKKYSKN